MSTDEPSKIGKILTNSSTEEKLYLSDSDKHDILGTLKQVAKVAEELNQMGGSPDLLEILSEGAKNLFKRSDEKIAMIMMSDVLKDVDASKKRSIEDIFEDEKNMEMIESEINNLKEGKTLRRGIGINLDVEALKSEMLTTNCIFSPAIEKISEALGYEEDFIKEIVPITQIHVYSEDILKVFS